MKRLALFTAVAAAVLMTAGNSIQTEAASQKYMTQINGKVCLFQVIYNPDFCFPDFGNGNLPDIELPDSECPGLELPGTGQPGEDQPGTDTEMPKPEVSAPEQPGEGQPGTDTETPEPESPAPEQPGENQPGTDIETPEPEAPAPEQPGENQPGTDTETTNPESSYAARVVELVNQERAKEGLSALTVDTGLEAAGNVRAKEIVSSFAHTRPDGTSFVTAIKEQGVSYRGAGENIAWGQRSPEEVVKAWMNSEGHRANIMNSKFTRIGVGHYVNAAGTNYWVQLFAY